MVSGLNGVGLRCSWQVQRLLVLTSLMLLTLLSGCASLLPPQEIEIPLSRLQQSIQKKFPYTERYFSLLDVTLSNPVLSTQPAADRMLIALDAQVLPPLIKTPWQGDPRVNIQEKNGKDVTRVFDGVYSRGTFIRYDEDEDTSVTQQIPSNQTIQNYPGRVYYVTTDQGGNFSVGPYFSVNQATGSATLNASAFNLSGLSSLRLGSIGAQIGAQINEFSTDSTFSQNSNVKVPTQAAVKTYVDTKVANVNLNVVRQFSFFSGAF
jgi:hypothetical protein